MDNNKRYWLSIAFIKGKYKFSSKVFTYNEFLDVISKDSYNLKEDLNTTHKTISAFLTRVFPDRPKTANKICIYLLNTIEKRFCRKCNQVKDFDAFYKDKNKSSGYALTCKQCDSSYRKENPGFVRSYGAKRRASKLQRIVKWGQDGIAEFYKNCPEGYQVDHIIPLQGKTVSGLHVLNNLQYLTVTENASKGNKYL